MDNGLSGMDGGQAEDAVRHAPDTGIQDDGSVSAGRVWVPASRYMSELALQRLVTPFSLPPVAEEMADIQAHRLAWDRHYYQKRFELAERLYPCDITRKFLDGVPVDIVLPTGIHAEAKSVVINLHGGAFVIGGGLGGLVESLPLAHAAQAMVVSVDYRQAPEHRFPAASEDVARVYRQLLQQYSPDSIALVGCSAGGLLVAQSLAWFQREGLPRPGAAALLFAPAEPRFDGDSRYTAPLLLGQPPPETNALDIGPMALYMETAAANDPMAAPLTCESVLSRFPPVFLASGTRAGDLSAVVHTHRRMLQAGVPAFLHVWDGLWHGFQYDVDLPESSDLYTSLGRFIESHLRAMHCY